MHPDARRWRQKYAALAIKCRRLERRIAELEGLAPVSEDEVRTAAKASAASIKEWALGLVLATISRAQRTGRITPKEAIDAARAVTDLLEGRRGPGRPAAGGLSPGDEAAARMVAGWGVDGAEVGVTAGDEPDDGDEDE